MPFLLSAVLSVGMLLGFIVSAKYYQVQKKVYSSFAMHPQLDYIVQLISEHYVDTIKQDALIENGIEGIIKSLDPHTVYIPPADIESVNEELEGNLYGIGVEFYKYKDTALILSKLENSPAYNSEISIGDKIIKVDTSIVAGVNIEDEIIINKIKGKNNTSVKLTLINSEGKEKKVIIKRALFPVSSIATYYTLPNVPHIGYIAINVFGERTALEFYNALRDLKSKNITKLIIDVRNNPGGYMNAATDILDYFIGNNDTLLVTKSRTENEVVLAHNEGVFDNLDLAILINDYSASASEILAGTMQDLDRGIIIGNRSFGKGLVQEQFDLPNGGAIRITTARYFLPSGRCIQKNYNQDKKQYHNEILNRYISKSNNDTIEIKKEFKTKKGKTVYSNEGIRPDVITEDKFLLDIALDTLLEKNVFDVFTSLFVNRFFGNQVFSYNNYEKVFKAKENVIVEKFNNFLQQYENINASKMSTEQKAKIKYLLLAYFAKSCVEKNEKNKRMSIYDNVIMQAVNALK